MCSSRNTHTHTLKLSPQPDAGCDTIKRISHGVPVPPPPHTTTFLPFCFFFLSFRCSYTHTQTHTHSFTYMLCPSLTLRLTGYWHVLGHLAERQMEPSHSLAPAWPTLPDSSLGSANHSQDQAQLCKTGFMAYHYCQILNTTSAGSLQTLPQLSYVKYKRSCHWWRV